MYVLVVELDSISMETFVNHVVLIFARIVKLKLVNPMYARNVWRVSS